MPTPTENPIPIPPSSPSSEIVSQKEISNVSRKLKCGKLRPVSVQVSCQGVDSSSFIINPIK